ncbi:Uncharacterised protein [Achromobacter xylosoxidans]|nr:Uncharacterised protein [Achromobacter xylosoxidans]
MPESPFGLTDEGFEDYRGITLAEYRDACV